MNINMNIEQMLPEIIKNYGALTFAIGIVMSAIYFVFYCLQSAGIMKIAQRHEIKHSWLAWVPIANAYIYGKIAFKDTFKAVALLVLKLAPMSLFPFLFSYPLFHGENLGIGTRILNLAYIVFLMYATYKIYKQMSDKATAMMIWSVLSCGTLIPVFLFAIRNNPIKVH